MVEFAGWDMPLSYNAPAGPNVAGGPGEWGVSDYCRSHSGLYGSCRRSARRENDKVSSGGEVEHEQGWGDGRKRYKGLHRASEVLREAVQLQ
jgi:hypothetical protein